MRQPLARHPELGTHHVDLVITPSQPTEWGDYRHILPYLAHMEISCVFPLIFQHYQQLWCVSVSMCFSLCVCLQMNFVYLVTIPIVTEDGSL